MDRPTSLASVLVHTSHPGREPVAGRLRNICQEAVHLLVPAYVDPESGVLVELSDGCLRSGRVLYCNPAGEGFVLSIAFLPPSGLDRLPLAPDRRRDGPRLPVENEPVRLCPVEGPPAAPVEAHLVDRSPAGLGLTAPCAFPSGTLLRVETASGVVFAEVRHCRPLPQGAFRLGLAVETSEPRRRFRLGGWEWSPLLRRLLQR